MLKSPQSNSLPLHADNFSTKSPNSSINCTLVFFVDIRLRGSVHYDKYNMYGNGSNQKFNCSKVVCAKFTPLISSHIDRNFDRNVKTKLHT